MSGLFEGWVDFNEPLTWDTSHVVRFDAMFKACTRLGESRVGNFSAAGDWQPMEPDPGTPTLTLNFGSAESVRDMFEGCTDVHLRAEDASGPVFDELKTTLGTRGGGRNNRITERQSARRRDEILEEAQRRRDRNRRDDTRTPHTPTVRGPFLQTDTQVTRSTDLTDDAVVRRRRAIEEARERARRAAARVASDVAASSVQCTVCLTNQARYASPCGHMLCGACTNGVLAGTALCPACRAPMTSDGLRQLFFFGTKKK